MKIVTIGSDPEFFILDRKGRPYPCTPFAKGTKDNPEPIPELGEGFFEQRDNLSFEGNIPYVTNKEDFVKNITALRDFFERKVSRFGCTISPNGVEYFPSKMLNSPEGSEFGCSEVVSSWDSYIYSLSRRPTPNLTGLKFRVAGFHIHIGIEVGKEDANLLGQNWAILIGRLFDIFLTIPSHKIKPEPERIQTYGKYGMIRVKPYGVECRTLSSYFTQRDWLPWVWDQIMKIELFINSCSKSDLVSILRYSYVMYDSRIMGTIADSLSDIKDKNFLKAFNETENIFDIHATSIRANSNSKTHYYTTSSGSTATTW